MAFESIVKEDGYGKKLLGNVGVDNIEWITGAYTFIPNLTSVGGNTFSITYQSGDLLFDQYTPSITGGSLAVSVPSIETYACPTRASGSVTWSDVNPVGGGIGNNYSVDGLMPAHIGRARSKTMNPYVYEAADGYFHEMFLLFAYTADNGLGVGAHYFYWVYMENVSQLWTRVPNTDLGLPAIGEAFDIWVPASVNVSNAKWSSWLVQDVDKLQGTGGGGGTGTVGDQAKVEDTILTVNEGDGTAAFGSINIATLQGASNTILGFLNGIEVNVEIGDPTLVGTSVDIVVDNTSGGYPAATDVYWHGSNYGVSASLLGDAEVGDVIRIYYLTS